MHSDAKEFPPITTQAQVEYASRGRSLEMWPPMKTIGMEAKSARGGQVDGHRERGDGSEKLAHVARFRRHKDAIRAQVGPVSSS